MFSAPTTFMRNTRWKYHHKMICPTRYSQVFRFAFLSLLIRAVPFLLQSIFPQRFPRPYSRSRTRPTSRSTDCWKVKSELSSSTASSAGRRGAVSRWESW